MNPLPGLPGGMPPKPKRAFSKQLQAIAERLPDAAQQSLLDYARFLSSQYPQQDSVADIQAKPIERPPEETVVAAIRRLSETYPMIDKQRLFDQTSAVMTAHILQDVTSEASIDQLEEIFSNAYQTYAAGD